jgi:hypothetical protein
MLRPKISKLVWGLFMSEDDPYDCFWGLKVKLTLIVKMFSN